MSANVYWKKALRDLKDNKARTFLVIFALMIGIISVGTVAVAYSILPREMDKNYLKTSPASATLAVSPLDDDLIRAVAALPYIKIAEARTEIIGRYLVAPGEWKELWLYVVPNFSGMRLDTFTPELGSWPPATGEILMEKTALGVAKTKIGDEVTIKLPNTGARSLTMTGTVHAPGLPPAWVEGRVYGYITPETLALFGSEARQYGLKILVSEKEFDKAAITTTVNELRGWLGENGYSVSGIDIPEPGRHPHADLMSAFITMLEAMGILALFMSGVLVTNMISAIVGRQVRQIGIMKAIGGSGTRIAVMYLMMVSILGIAATAIGLPISVFLGRTLANYEAVQMLNFEIFDYCVDAWAFALIIALGTLTPLVAAAIPVFIKTRVTVLAALSDTGTGGRTFGTGRIDAMLGGIKGNARLVILSVRNAFRRRLRLVLTLLTLTVAGASFITAMNVAASIDKAVAKKFDASSFDIDIAFSKAYPKDEIERVVRQADGVESVETWANVMATTIPSDGAQGRKVRVIAPLPDTPLAPKPPISAGRWLRGDDENAIVMNTALMDLYGIVAGIGDEVALEIDGKKTVWRLIGTTQEFMNLVAYVPYEYLTRTTAHNSNTVVRATDKSMADRMTKDLEILLGDEGFDVYTMWKTSDTRKVVEDHMVLITGILLLMAALFVGIGGLGITSTMSLNVVDRTRELGIMRSVGASTANIMQIIVSEGTIIGVISWFLAILLSLPFSSAMSQVFNLLLKSPLTLTTSPAGWIQWLLVISLIGASASALPAWSAAKRPVSEVLAYE
jgi:putative ABC transport system permease protein